MHKELCNYFYNAILPLLDMPFAYMKAYKPILIVNQNKIMNLENWHNIAPLRKFKYLKSVLKYSSCLHILSYIPSLQTYSPCL